MGSDKNSQEAGIIKVNEPEVLHQMVIQQRGRQYGGGENLACIAELKDIYRRYSVGERTTTYDHCMEMVFVKIARLITGSIHIDDSYEDAKGYLELARRLARGENVPG